MMGPSSLPKTVVSSPSQIESQASSALNSSPSISSDLLNRIKFEETVDKNRSQTLDKDAHQKRIKQLRKELEYIQNTAWKYQHIDTYIGQ